MNQKRLEDNIEIMPVDIKPNEMVLFYRDNQLIGDASGKGFCCSGMTRAGESSGQREYAFLREQG